MTQGKHLLLLAGYVLLARCQQVPQVYVSPPIKQYFMGDVFILSCDNSSSGSVMWYYNNMKQGWEDGILRISAASPQHSGSYQCERNGKKSNIITIEVQEFAPSASLTIHTGQPVMQTGASVLLKIELDSELEGWNCWDYREGRTRMIKLKAKDASSLVFQPNRLIQPESIFWCTDRAQTIRSNQIIVRTSAKSISLEMYPLPAIVGESLTLRCLAWGTNRISKAVFYKNNLVISDSGNPFYSIEKVTESEKASYKCDATFTYTGHNNGPANQESSEAQEVFVQEPPMKPELSHNMGLSCSCPRCPGGASYNWYYKKADGQPWALIMSDQDSMMPKSSGIYACRAVWATKRTLLSSSVVYQPPIKSILIGVIIVLIILIFAAAAIYIFCKRRNTTGAIYEDVALRTRDKGDDKYETLKKPYGAQKDGEYDTLNPGATGGQKKGDEYEPLNKAEVKEGVYHTLGMEEAAGAAGGYEALRKEGVQEVEYQTLESKGAGGGEGGYEALKKEGMKEGVYHTLESKGAGGGEGGYEALKKEGMKEGVYHTLGLEEAVGKKDKEHEVVEENK